MKPTCVRRSELGKWVCKICREGPPAGVPLRTWLLHGGSKCAGARRPEARIGAAGGLPLHRLAPDERYRVGNRLVNTTHLLAAYRGFHWCWCCGASGSARVELLALPCQGRKRITYQRRRLLRRVYQGLTPKSGRPWPEPESLSDIFPTPPAEFSGPPPAEGR